ncbi:MAG: 30S ribosomal protein S16, partial [bacterium]|nr:30S ribosomal protein S16 [bacterium]
MLKIRLQRIGKKNSSSYRIALVEHTTSPQGKFIELLGSYSPRLKEKKFNKERIEYWLTKGAQASPTVHNLLVDEKIIDKEKVKAWKPKKKTGE